MQVASSFLSDLAVLDEPPSWLSSAEVIVSHNLRDHLTCSLRDIPGRVVVRDATTTPMFLLPAPRRARASLRFRLFGPSYERRQARTELAGFALPKMVFPIDPVLTARRSPRTLAVSRMKTAAVRRADLFVVETQAVADALSLRLGIGHDRIAVAPNEPHSVFMESPASVRPWTGRSPLRLIYPARGYNHKNHRFLSKIVRAGAERLPFALEFHVTLRSEEWRQLAESERLGLVNHGEVSPQELKRLYSTVHAVVFPSLMECASATPLEARIMGLPLLASERDFVTATAGAASLFFDPVDPKSAVDSILEFSRRSSEIYADAAADSAAYRATLVRRPRTQAYLEIIECVLATGALPACRSGRNAHA